MNEEIKNACIELEAALNHVTPDAKPIVYAILSLIHTVIEENQK